MPDRSGNNLTERKISQFRKNLQNFESGLALTEAEWSEEWSSVLRLASADPRTNINNNVSLGPKRRSRLSTVSEDELDGNPLYESLEEVHVLVLAHVLKRPIIVVSDTVLKVSIKKLNAKE